MNILTRLRKPLYFVLIASMLLQNSLFLSAFKPENARATTGVTVVLNELMPNPSIGNDWVEIYNTAGVDQDLTGWYLKDSANNTKGFSGTLSAGSYLTVDWTNYLNNGGDSVTLYCPGDVVMDSKTYVSDDVTSDKTIGKIPNGSGIWTNNLTPTKGFANALDAIDNIKPTSTVTNPTNGSHINALAEITGTASDNENIASVNIMIRDYTASKYFDGTTWVDTETWLTANIEPNTAGINPLTTVNWAFADSDLTLVSGNEYKIYSKATDTNSNVEDNYSNYKVYFYFDNEAPTGSIIINEGADATNGNDWWFNEAERIEYPQLRLDFSYYDASYDLSANEFKTEIYRPIAYMKISNNSDLSDDSINKESGEWIEYTETYIPWNVSTGDGIKNVYVQFKDIAGNVSDVYTDDIFYSVKNSGENKIYLEGTNNQFSLFDGQVEFEINTNEPTEFFYSTYSSNPVDNTSGIKFLNHYYDFNPVDDENISFPATIRIYFTQEDLDNAGLTMDQIQGLFYWNFETSTWELYPNSDVYAYNIDGYVGYVEAVINHFTPMSIGGDITAPGKVLNLVATPGNAKVALDWDKIADADKYEVRYRRSTSDDSSVAYSDVYTVSSNETEIAGLTNGIQYEFNVRAIDKAGNKGEWAIVVATPYTSGSSSNNDDLHSSWYGYFGTDTAFAADNNSSNSTNDKKTETISSDNDKVKGEETTEGETEGARTAVTIGIIIIAIGAALGGYYGYQWWIAGSHDEEEKKDKPKTTDNKPKPKKVNRRW